MENEELVEKFFEWGKIQKYYPNGNLEFRNEFREKIWIIKDFLKFLWESGLKITAMDPETDGDYLEMKERICEVEI